MKPSRLLPVAAAAIFALGVNFGCAVGNRTDIPVEVKPQIAASATVTAKLSDEIALARRSLAELHARVEAGLTGIAGDLAAVKTTLNKQTTITQGEKSKTVVTDTSWQTTVVEIAIAAFAFASLFGLGLVLVKERGRRQIQAQARALEQGLSVTEGGLAVCFPPPSESSPEIVRRLNQVKNSLLIQAGQFMSSGLLAAIREAKKRGVEVTVLLNQANLDEEKSIAPALAAAGVKTLVYPVYQLAYHQIMILDAQAVIIGLFFYALSDETGHAEEWLVIEKHPRIVRAYRGDFQSRLARSVAYQEKKPPCPGGT